MQHEPDHEAARERFAACRMRSSPMKTQVISPTPRFKLTLLILNGAGRSGGGAACKANLPAKILGGEGVELSGHNFRNGVVPARGVALTPLSRATMRMRMCVFECRNVCVCVCM